MSGHTYTQDDYSNPRCVHARRGLIIIVLMKYIHMYSQTSLIRAAWDQAVSVILKMPLTLKQVF